MGNNIKNFGERRLEGEYDKVKSFGSININNSNIKKLSNYGAASIEKSRFEEIISYGFINITDGSAEIIKSYGALEAKGILNAQFVEAGGILSCERLECMQICYENTKKANRFGISGSFKAALFEAHREIDLDFDYSFKYIFNGGGITCSNEIKCSSFFSLGRLGVKAISADEIYISTGSPVSVGSLTGHKIVIGSNISSEKSYKELKTYYKYKENKEQLIASLENIEGDIIQLENVNVGTVCGADVTIGELCSAERVEYSGSIKVSERAAVGEIIKL